MMGEKTYWPRVVYMGELDEVQSFVKEASTAFAKDPKWNTYGAPGPGSLFAVRWGLHRRAVLVMRIDENFEPLIFGDIVPEGEDD